MTKIPYNKPATTYAAQVTKLRDRGMVINDEDAAKDALQHYNYYRLGAYWLPFEKDHATHEFRDDTDFNQVLDLYDFDRNLRLLCLDAIERIEVSVRAQWAYRLGHLHGSHAHLNAALFKSRYYWNENKESLTKETDRSDEIFIEHLRQKYIEELPPIWAVCEVMSLGLLSKWYSNLGPMNIRRLIANVYKLDEGVFESWLHHLSVLRNTCAHHSRLWNRDFSKVRPQPPLNKPQGLKEEFVTIDKIYNSLIILLHMMSIVSPANNWKSRLRGLLENHPNYLGDMGFPADWRNRAIWNA
jgi:abortive infection bacteriophage resistance protein